MTASNYASCEAQVLAHEGSEYTDGIHPYDPGGPTRYGITLIDARAFWKSNATADDVKTMPESVAQQIYKTKYWDVLNCDNLPSGVDDAVVDYGINSGNSRSGKVLRRLLSLPDTDWHVTPEVITACSKRDPVALINGICDERMQFLESLSIWPTYKNGWTTRVKEVRQFSTQLAAHQATPVATPMPKPPSVPATPSAKGTHPPPSTAPVVNGGASITTVLAGWLHWLGAHPALIAVAVILGVLAILWIVSIVKDTFQAKQDAPVAPVVPIPPILAPGKP